MPFAQGIALIMLLSGPPRASITAPYCRPNDDTGQEFQREIRSYTEAFSGDNVIVRDSLRLQNSASGFQVLDEAVCRKANTAYKSALSGHGTGSSNRVYVLKFSPSGVYAVLDPDYRYGTGHNIWTVVIFDSKFRKLSMYHS